MPCSRYINRINTLIKLGPQNLVWAAYYRLLLKLGVVTKNMDIKAPVKGPFFKPKNIRNDELNEIELHGFGWCSIGSDVPDWNKTLVTNIKAQLSDASLSNTHWSKISDFDLNIGDIKTVWELSRFDWVLVFTVNYIKTGDSKYLNQLNEWLSDWCEVNPTNAGINWKCGQEASIRVMHLCTAALLLNQVEDLSPSLIALINEHLERIKPTVLYAMAQDNNHGTSEAAALFVGGEILGLNGVSLGNSYSRLGRKWLENRAKRLIENDGSFSQYSINYHRVMLDSISLCEVFRRRFELEKFNDSFYLKMSSATSWLFQFTDPRTGDVPNSGANDGARLIQLTDTGYRDFRPSIQLASGLFLKHFKYPVIGKYHQSVKLLLSGVSLPVICEKKSKSFPDGGFYSLVKKNNTLLFRSPNFKFRPGQSDTFHVDFWLGEDNILRDGGSYSYNSGDEWLKYFSGVQSHNTVEFDDKEPMRKISRFLYGDWIKPKINNVSFNENVDIINATYKTYFGASHNRNVSLSDDNLVVTDNLDSFQESAILRWRLIPGKWAISNNKITNGNVTIEITSDSDFKRFEIVKGFESRYYLQKTELPVLEIELTSPSKVVTLVTWNKN